MNGRPPEHVIKMYEGWQRLVDTDPKKALEFLEREIKKIPEFAEAYFYKALTFEMLFNKSKSEICDETTEALGKKAVAAYNKAVELDPSYEQAGYHRGKFLKELAFRWNKYYSTKAVESFKQVVKLKQGSKKFREESWKEMIGCLVGLGEWDKVIKICEETLESVDFSLYSDAQYYKELALQALREAKERFFGEIREVRGS